MGTDKRKYIRFECFVPVDLLEVEGEPCETREAKVENVSREGICLILSLDTDFVPGQDLSFKVHNPEDKTTGSLTGQIIWSRPRGDKIEVGLKITNIEKALKAGLLDVGYAAWLEEQKKDKAK